jgi:hypothetical protein
MQPEPVPRWIILTTAFIAIGICCAGLFLAGPLYAPYLPSMPARAAQATVTPRPTFTLIPTRTATATPTARPTQGRLVFPTVDPADLPTLTPVPTPAPTRAAPVDDGRRLVGQGNKLENFNLSRGGLIRFTLSHGGEGHFAVWLLDAEGNDIDLLANEIGRYDGEKSGRLDPGNYFLEVTADGQWLINIGQP